MEQMINIITADELLPPAPTCHKPMLSAAFSLSSPKILNLYAGIGGNRKLWGNDVQVTAVEIDAEIASVYQKNYPNDLVIVGDSQEYLLKNFDTYDFIWASPPCPTHGQYRYNVGFKAKGYKPVFPDMKLYEVIFFLKHYFQGKYAVENTIPFYEPLIPPTAKLGRHLIWSNFYIAPKDFKSDKIRDKNKLTDFSQFDLSKTKIVNKRQVLRNCTNSELGLYVLQSGR